ncbi:MAG: tRNA lysidine(34) synthetase TilS [Chlamydia sp.]
MKRLHQDTIYMKCRPHLKEAYFKSYPDLSPNIEPISVIGVSGGADSTLLLHFLSLYYEERGWSFDKIHVAYVDHGWRRESHNESQELAKKCIELGFSFHGLKIEQQDSLHNNLEERARLSRYQLLLECCESVSSRVLFVGHQKNDQVEGLLKRIFEGASLQSFAGMERFRPISPTSNVWLSRPLLSLSRSEIEVWLSGKNISYFIDPTNSSYQFTRARIRHGILPVLSEYFQKNLEDPLVQISERASALTLFISSFYALLFEEAIFEKEVILLSTRLDIDEKLISFAENPFIVEETLQLFKGKSKILAKMSAAQIHGITETFIGNDLHNKSERIFAVSLGTVLVRKGFLCIFPYQIQKESGIAKNLMNDEQYAWNSFVVCSWSYVDRMPSEYNLQSYSWVDFFRNGMVEMYIPVGAMPVSVLVSHLSDAKRRRGYYSLNCPFSSFRSFFPSFWDEGSGRLLYSPLCRPVHSIKNGASRYIRFSIVLHSL